MACGTPVIAVRRGSMPELIIDGKTGFLVNSVDEAVAKFHKLSHISRHHCRKWVKKQFTVELMVQRYLETYRKIIKESEVG